MIEGQLRLPDSTVERVEDSRVIQLQTIRNRIKKSNLVHPALA